MRTASILFGVALLAVHAAGVAGWAAEPKAEADLLAVAEDNPWLMAVATPVAAKLRHHGELPLLVALSTPPTREADWVATLSTPGRGLIISVGTPQRLTAAWQKLGPKVLTVAADPVAGSLAVALHFWKQADRAVLAAADDPEGILQGATLAGQEAIPLVIRQRSENKAAIAHALHDLGVRRVTLVVGSAAALPAWATGHPPWLEVLDARAAGRRLIETWGAAHVRNILIARLPGDKGPTGSTAWLAPYVSLTRGAPLVLCHSASAAAAEADVWQLIRRFGLAPRNITVLADYASLGQNLVDVEGDQRRANGVADELPGEGDSPEALRARAKYRVQTEPCVPTKVQQVASMGVGRIPLESLEDASVLFARGLVRQRRMAEHPPRLLMVANSSLNRRPLPLCETISRVTAAEFKNLHVPVDEFYGKLADSPEVLAAAKTASLIIYEGHLAYQDLFDVPATGRATAPDSYYDEELDALEDGGSSSRDAHAHARKEATRPRTVAVAPHHRLQGPLTGLPIVVLQSCDSLDEPVLWRIDELGGVAVIGSITPIHSGSGSALVNALADAVLYRGATLGEALRDAQNYLFCLEDLKSLRGHKEQAKSRRVAISFRLWGDPELSVLPTAAEPPAEAPLSARWTAAGQLTLDVPSRRLPEARSSKYFARMFPAAQAAGMVQQREGDSARRLVAMYFFRIALPEKLARAGELTVQAEFAQRQRLAFRVDPVGRLLYLVYLPEKEIAGETLELRVESAPKGDRSKFSADGFPGIQHHRAENWTSPQTFQFPGGGRL